jgi:hypothetical protein
MTRRRPGGRESVKNAALSRRGGDRLKERAAELARIEVLDSGNTYVATMHAMDEIVCWLRYYAGLGYTIKGECGVRRGSRPARAPGATQLKRGATGGREPPAMFSSSPKTRGCIGMMTSRPPREGIPRSSRDGRR